MKGNIIAWILLLILAIMSYYFDYWLINLFFVLAFILNIYSLYLFFMKKGDDRFGKINKIR